MKNIGSLDKKIRIAAGLIIIATGFYLNSYWGAVGLVPLITALIGWCPPYAILGINTCQVKAEQE